METIESISVSRTYPSQTLKQVLLRIPEEMRLKLDQAAKDNDCSLTTEVLRRLESTFPEDTPWLSKVNDSPLIKAERQIIASEARLRLLIEKLEARVEKLESKK